MIGFYFERLNMNKNILWLCLCLLTSGLIAQKPTQDTEKYWVFFTDKGADKQYVQSDLLSQRALDRRAKHGVAVNQSDWPVNPEYVSQVAGIVSDTRHRSRWFNSVSAWMTPAQLSEVLSLPFVKEVKPIHKVFRDMDAPQVQTKAGYFSGITRAQLEIIGLDKLHQNGYNGNGIWIAVMDNGFREVDENPVFSHLFEDGRIVSTWDFVNNETNVYDQGGHGSWVLSILAGHYEPTNDSLNYYGSAPGASYILCHTEDDGDETSQEEDNWVAAMEYADSLGADIFSTSLGYREMNSGVTYSYVDMDGNTTIITRGADIAASKGILVVNSAGNAGGNKITAPADGDSVLAIGAVDAFGVLAGFSSQGPSADRRLKPDLCGMGSGNAFVSGINGASGGPNYSNGGGTSFSCPTISGLAASLMQSNPSVKNMELFDILLRASDRYENPDTFYGHGIPSGPLAFELLNDRVLDAPSAVSFSGGGVELFPNPASSYFNLVMDNEGVSYAVEISMFDLAGRKIFTSETTVQPFYNVFRFDRENHYPDVVPGIYIVRLRNLNEKDAVFAGKIRID